MYPPCLVMPIFRRNGRCTSKHRLLCVLAALIRTQAERTQRMKIQWKFADGTTSEVEVNEEIGNYITASRREESNLARKERYHCYSLDAIDFEGLEYAAKTTPEIELTRKEDATQIKSALDKLSETQKRRLLMLADGLSINEIARIENIAPNAAWKSIEGAKKKFKKHFELGV
ncbi:RNA polymerase sigma factor, region 3/4 [Syntrophomonas zehnderi OL-4]|uniref:RNA polymerase sigma factor, region 3/4 n=2 Tax=Syntrophomonas TaxID=862 RepID=A0A0E4C872_9FIRM|nr:RNA polymerase sigma factor, region 3/4 [Syntrophomonas zehnderi OL-4]CFX31853.1 RNA polymerase sigma factor, region 3/4 [Syntrophomonas zehnderi OL-4]